MATERRPNPYKLESEVKELMGTAKVKIATLRDELSRAEKDNQELETVISKSTAEIEEANKRVAELSADLEKTKDQNATLQKLKVAKDEELKLKNQELTELAESSANEHRKLRLEIKRLEEQAKDIRAEREKETIIHQQEQENEKRHIEQLLEMISRKEEQIAKVQAELVETSEIEKARLDALHKEKKLLLDFFASV